MCVPPLDLIFGCEYLMPHNQQCVRHPDAHRLDMKSFVNRPIPRLLRYELLLKGILDETHLGHDDCDEIPQVLEVIKALGKDAQPGVVSAEQKVELWRYNSNIVFKPGEAIVGFELSSKENPDPFFTGHGPSQREPFIDPHGQTASATG